MLYLQLYSLLPGTGMHTCYVHMNRTCTLGTFEWFFDCILLHTLCTGRVTSNHTAKPCCLRDQNGVQYKNTARSCFWKFGYFQSWMAPSFTKMYHVGWLFYRYSTPCKLGPPRWNLTSPNTHVRLHHHVEWSVETFNLPALVKIVI